MSAGVADMTGKVCVVTGATAGLGKETALELAKMSATVVLVARDAAKASRTADEIETAAPNAQVDVVLADFASLEAVSAAAREIGARYRAVNVLVNNAGLAKKDRTLSADGYELTFAVNHLAPFLFTRELLPLLEAGAPARIVNVASAAEAHGPIDFDDLQSETNYRGFRVYGKTKLMNVLFTYELARRLANSGVTVNALHPGAVATDLMRQLPRWLFALISPFLLTPEAGAKTQIFLASSPAVEGVSGKYFVKGRAVRSSLRSYNAETQKQLWDMSETLLGSRLHTS